MFFYIVHLSKAISFIKPWPMAEITDRNASNIYEFALKKTACKF